MSISKTLVVIVGPTGIGKTSLAIEVAKYFKTEIISSDSRQFYKEMKIGTAVPEESELAAVPHHFIQHISIHQTYSVGDFEKDAMTFIRSYFENHDILVMVGGSGLYEKAITQGLDEFPEVNPQIRIDLNQELLDFGLEKLQKELKMKDSKYYEKADIENPHRVIRALEIIRGTGKSFSSFLTQKPKARDFNIIKIGLQLSREEIYDRINRRVDQMIENKLFDEVKSLHQYKNLNALNTVGYSELFKVIEEQCKLGFAIEEIKKNTRRFAKRQLTWYRKDDAIHWFKPQQIDEIIALVQSKI